MSRLYVDISCKQTCWLSYVKSKVWASLVGIIVISIIFSNPAFGATPPSKPTDVVADDVSPTKVVHAKTGILGVDNFTL